MTQIGQKKEGKYFGHQRQHLYGKRSILHGKIFHQNGNPEPTRYDGEWELLENKERRKREAMEMEVNDWIDNQPFPAARPARPPAS